MAATVKHNGSTIDQTVVGEIDMDEIEYVDVSTIDV